MGIKKVIFLLLIFNIYVYSNDKTCIYINSYHEGYAWSDKISLEIKTILKYSCDIKQFNLDSKRNKDEKFIKEKALEAKKLIDSTNPDIVIFSDDNAAKYLVEPYYKNSKIPFLFCGINWTAKEYGFPYKNVKGIIEILPVESILKLSIELSSGKNGIFLGDNTITDKKDLSYFQKSAIRENIKLDSMLVNTLEEWKRTYLMAQENYDFIILGHNSAIKGWNDEKVRKFIKKNSKILSFSTYRWMMPFSMIGNIIKAEEHGQWVANSAKAILEGYDINNISITTNKSWNSYINYELLNVTNVKLPREIKTKYKKY